MNELKNTDIDSILALQQRYVKLLLEEMKLEPTEELSVVDDCYSCFWDTPSKRLNCRSESTPETLRSKFNAFFKDDLYGRFQSDDNLILSSGDLNADEFPLCQALRYPIAFALEQNWYGYSNSLGHFTARNAVAELMDLRMKSYDVKVNNVSLINGVTNGLNTVLKTLSKTIQHPFKILTHLPTYSPFLTTCKETAPTDCVIFKEGVFDENIILDAVGSDTRVILLLGDLNPLGQMISIPMLNRILKECEQRGIWLVFDEAGAVFPEYDYSLLDYSGRLILLNSDSKSLGIPGLKTGFLVASTEFVESFYCDASSSYGSPASLLYLFQEFHARFRQFMCMGLNKLDASHLALFGNNYMLNLSFLQLLYDDYLCIYKRYSNKVYQKRAWLTNQVSTIPKHLVSKYIVPETGVNMSICIAQNDDSYRFFLSLLNDKKVAVFPCSCSGIDSDCWVRISYAIADDILEDGFLRLKQYLQEHDVYSRVLQVPIYYSCLIQHGEYLRYPELNFFGHIDEVHSCMKKIWTWSGKKMNSEIESLCESLSYLHDAGKVISIRLAALQRVASGMFKTDMDWGLYSDLELLGLKTQLQRGDRFSFEQLLSFISEEERSFVDLIVWDQPYSPNDELVRERLFKQIGGSHTAIEMLQKGVPELNASSSMNDEMCAVLDIADKCSDYLNLESLTLQSINDALAKKQSYVIKRYAGKNKKVLSEINNAFDRTRKNVSIICEKQIVL